MPGSLKASPNFVETDLRALGLLVPFTPEQIVLGEYTFLPFVRTGLAAALVPPAAGATRATVPVSVSVQDDKGGAQPVSRTVTLRGPGDVVGIDTAQVVRRVPSPHARNVEEAFLAHVEFDRPELPWLFSPEAPVNNRLRPWLALVVVDAQVSGIEPGPAELPNRLRTRLGELPSTADAWAWAHAQVAGKKAGPPSVADRLSESHATTNLSRLVCPRKLDPETHYVAAIVPLYDAGVKAGLGLPGGTLQPAWSRGPGSNPDAEVLLPVYDAWRFSTGKAGDFESLAKKLVPVAAPWNVGRRIIDASRPRGGVAPLQPNDVGKLQVLRCALVSPAPMPAGQPPEGQTWAAPKRDELRQRLDAAAKAPNAADLPRVGPRVYARWQKGQATVGAVGDAHWFQQMNTNPVHRIVAGVGTRVVRKDQEQLMQAAWLQVGEIEAANALLTRVQFARYVSDALHRNHLGRLGLGELAQVMRAAQDKVRLPGSALTVHGSVGRSATPPAAMSAAFRRATRLRGPVARFLTPASAGALRGIVGTDARGFADLRRAYAEPDGVRGLSAGAVAAIPAALVARKLGVAPATAAQTLTQRLTTRRDLSVADRLLTPMATWNLGATPTVDLTRFGAERVLEQATTALPARFASDPAHSESVAPLLVGIGNAGLADLSTRANDTVRRIGASVPAGTIGTTPIGSTPIGTIPGGIRPVRGVASLDPRAVGRMEPEGVAASEEARVAPPATTAAARPVLQPFTPTVALAARSRFETATSREITATLAAGRAMSTTMAATAFASFARGDGVADLAGTPARAPLAVARATLLDAVAPRATLTAYAKGRLKRVPAWLPQNWFDDGRLQRIMAAPRFDRPMYEALDAYDRDWLVPGLGSIRKTDFVTVLLTNPAFTETFLVGLSDEMGRELLWRDYPTDQRGTYFFRFWDPDADELGQRIHAFAPTPLGHHMKASVGGAEGRVVLVVRGELLQRYPDAIIVALRAGSVDAQGHPTFIDPDTDPTAMARVLFHAHLDPDITLVGFDLSAAQVRNERWWFVIAEHPTAPRFGLDLFNPGNTPVQPAGANRNALDWNDLGALEFGKFLRAGARTLPVGNKGGSPDPIAWPETSAMVAGALLQNPVRAAFDAKKLIGSLL